MNNLYLVSQVANKGYDTYDSFVVVAESSHKAALMSPCEYYPHWSEEKRKWYGYTISGQIMAGGNTWTPPENVEVRQIGTTEEALGKVLIASFNAG